MKRALKSGIKNKSFCSNIERGREREITLVRKQTLNERRKNKIKF